MANVFDAANALEGEPTQFVAGDFLQWKKTSLVVDYPPANYTLTYTAKIIGGNDEFSIIATNGSTHYLITAESSVTAEYSAGNYRWQLEMLRNSDSQRAVLSRGEFKILPDLDVSSVDLRSHAELMVSKIESILAGKADSDVSSYSVAGRSLTKMGFQELIDARNFYKGEVIREKAIENAQAGRQTASTIKVRF